MASKASEQKRSWAETPPTSPAIRNISGEVIARQTWLDSLAAPIQNWLLTFYGQPGSSMRKLKDVLNGTWLGHPVHPAATDIPIGAWTSTMLLDLIWLNNEKPEIAQASDITLLLGLFGAVGAAVTGVSDWSDQDGTDRRMGLVHGLLNLSITATNLVSFVFRTVGKRRTAVALSSMGYLVMLYTANLGGELSFAKGIGVNHVAWEGGSDDFVPVMDEQDLPQNKLTRVDAAGIAAVLLRKGNTIYAIAATCSHLAGPLDEGTVEGDIVQCPWHGSRFCMRDGSVVNGPAVYAQPTFTVRVRDGKIQLRRNEHA